jgi:hypothetical protein
MESDKFFFNKIFNIKYNKEIDETIYYDEECISKCYPKNTFFYDKIVLLPHYSDKEKCSILPDFHLKQIIKDCKTNKFIENIDDEDSVLSIIVNNSYAFLNNLYNMKTYDDVLQFLEINIKDLPLLTQRRILNCIYCAYITNNNFPNKKYIFKIKNILNLVFNLKLNSNKIFNKIIKLKNNKKYKENNDIFLYIYNKYNK